MSQQQPQAQVNLQRIYLKGASLEHPAAPVAFFEENSAPVQDDLQIQVSVTQLQAEVYEVSVSATLTLAREDKTMMLLEVDQAGVFQLTNVTAENREGVLGVQCAAMVYSYLRANFADLMTRATLPPMHIPEPDWMGQFQARQQANAAVATAAASVAAAND